MKKQIQLVTALLCFCTVSLFSQVTVTGVTTATYSTVNAAFAAINSGLHTGAITIDITGNTTEPATPTPLAASGQTLASYTSIIIRPTVTATISGVMVTGRGVLELDGADNVTINGDIAGGPVGRDLTISNDAANNIAATAAIRLIGRTTLGLGATNNSIMNCIINGSTPGNDGFSGSTVSNSFGIYAGANATALTTTGTGDNYDNLTISNNEIKRAYFGIYIGGTATNMADNVLISSNLLGSSTTGENLSFKGVQMGNANTPTITLNEIFNLKVNTSVNPAGIEMSSGTGYVITRNKIYGIWSTSTGGWGAYGINLAGGNNHSLINNVIYDIFTTNYSATTTTWNAFGIRITSGTGHKLYYNSVNMFGNYTMGGTVTSSSALLITSTAVTGLDIRNNIFSNKMTSTTATTKKFMAVWFPTSYNFLNATLNNNAYMVTNDADHFVGKIGTTTGSFEYANLGAWQAVSQVNNPTNDVNSVPPVNGNAPFIADNNLQIPMNTITPIESGAVLIPALGTNIDYNANVRPLAGVNPNTNPDMGAYEFDGLAGVATDAGVQILTSPLTTGCYGASENLVVTIKNYGTASISNIPVTVTVSGVVSQTSNATYSGTITAGGSASFTVGTLNMTTVGVYSFNASTSLPGDLNAPNDAMAQTTRTVIAPVALPQSVSFTGFTGSNLPTMFPNWYESAGVTVPSGTTSVWTSQTGLNGVGNITARINLVAASRNEWIVGPKFTATSAAQISFDAAVTDLASVVNPDVMGSDDMVRVMVSTDCGVSYAPIFTISATNSLSTTFTNFTVPLGAYAGQDIIIAFLATDGPVDDLESYDFHLDNINLYNASATDAGVAALAAPTATACFTTNEDVVVDIKNYGTGAISNVPVTVTISGPIPQVVSSTYAGSIPVGGTVTYTVGTANLSSAGVYTFNSTTGLAGDANTFNDVNNATRTVTPMFSLAGLPSICSGNSATLAATGSASSYSWSTGATTSSIVVSPTVNTIYSVTGVSGSCTLTLTKTLTVNNPTITGTGATYCGTSGTGTLNATAFSTVNWYSSPSSTVSLSTGNSYVPPSAASTTTYYAEATSVSNGSIQTLFTGGNGCGGGNMFDVTATAGTIQIDSLDVNTSAATSSTFTVMIFYKAGTYLGNETTAASWIPWDTIVATSAGASMPSRVKFKNSLTIPASALHALFVNFPANYTNGTNAYSNPDVTLQMGSGLCSQFGGNNAGRMFNGNVYYSKPGCTSPRIPVVLTVAPNPTVMASPASSTLCSGASATLTASGATTYSWSNGANTAMTVVTPTASTTYTVIGDNSGCTDSSMVSITVGTNPTVTAVANPSVLCAGSTGTINASGAVSYTWSTGAMSTGILITPSVTTTYSVIGEDPAGCTGISMITVTVATCTGIENTIAQNNGIAMYPNPARENITLYVSAVTSDLKLELYDALGKRILVRTIEKTNTPINISELPDGIYIYRVTENSSTVKQGKFVKE